MIEVSKYSFHFNVSKKRFLFISDIHECDIKEAKKIVCENDVDAILFGGDVMQFNSDSKRGLELIKICADIKPTFVSIGNHEAVSGLDYRNILESVGAKVLDNEYVDFDGMIIGGLSSGTVKRRFLGRFRKTLPPDVRFIDEFSKINRTKILLSHHPEYFEYLKDKKIDLILSGHAHGGQWRIFNRGIFAPGQCVFPKYTSGLYENKLLVSRGLGNPHLAPRINNKPEIIYLEIE